MAPQNEFAYPFVSTQVAKFVDARITGLKETKSQRQIATEAGYDKPNIISMIKRGETRLPLDRIAALARALETDPSHLLRLAIEDYFPDLTSLIEDAVGRFTTKNEHEFLLKPWRDATENADPAPEEHVARSIRTTLYEYSKAKRF